MSQFSLELEQPLKYMFVVFMLLTLAHKFTHTRLSVSARKRQPLFPSLHLNTRAAEAARLSFPSAALF